MRTAFSLRMSDARWHPALALMAAHGISDLDDPIACLPRYVLCAALPLPPRVVTAAFLASSVAHFAADVGWRGSAALHAGVGLVGAAGGARWAARAMTLYMLAWHLPLHYARLLRARRYVGLLVAAAFTVMLLLATQDQKRVCLGQDAQRVVIAHVIHNF